MSSSLWSDYNHHNVCNGAYKHLNMPKPNHSVCSAQRLPGTVFKEWPQTDKETMHPYQDATISSVIRFCVHTKLNRQCKRKCYQWSLTPVRLDHLGVSVSNPVGQKTKPWTCSGDSHDHKALTILMRLCSRARNNLLHSGPMLRKIPHPLI